MPEINSNKKALLAGATGLVGSHLLNLLLNDPYYSEVIVPVRNKTGIVNPKLTEIIINYDKLDSYKDSLKADDIFCCLGTTIKKAGSQEAFTKVDFNYPLELANLALNNGARQYLIITSIGANEKSKVFYTRIKGKAENEITKLKFKSISIFRPSMILGERKEKRAKENLSKILFKVISPLLAGSLKKYKGIKAADIAKAMLTCAKEFHQGISIYESDVIKSIAG